MRSRHVSGFARNTINSYNNFNKECCVMLRYVIITEDLYVQVKNTVLGQCSTISVFNYL